MAQDTSPREGITLPAPAHVSFHFLLPFGLTGMVLPLRWQWSQGTSVGLTCSCTRWAIPPRGQT